MLLEVAAAANVKPDTILERRPDGRGGLKVAPIKPQVIMPENAPPHDADKVEAATIEAQKMDRE